MINLTSNIVAKLIWLYIGLLVFIVSIPAVLIAFVFTGVWTLFQAISHLFKEV